MFVAVISPWLYTVIVKVTKSPGPTLALCPVANFLFNAKSNGKMLIIAKSLSSSSPPLLLISLSPPNGSPLVASGVESTSVNGVPVASVNSLISAQLAIEVLGATFGSTVKVISTKALMPGAKGPAIVFVAKLPTATQSASLSVNPLGI